ncbi:hypothetical protein STRIP9103_02544 [Streptomyces ipomoeae 91-03]|jgi:hypothetical protein|uniref:Uncharacterized protein n=1 Tax=Streptomyces ipomoeae 91-03 TaxID=698759 RepID=L1KIF7_9ACTN|nr:hypothetical protein STRIP9103_02544 [Streptomyces ipomoeae 91-03]
MMHMPGCSSAAIAVSVARSPAKCQLCQLGGGSHVRPGELRNPRRFLRRRAGGVVAYGKLHQA